MFYLIASFYLVPEYARRGPESCITGQVIESNYRVREVVSLIV
jgi:hypothetical protein